METAEIIVNALRPERWAKIQRILDQRLGAVRVAVEDLHHPHNMSAILRTCEALGVQHVHAADALGEFTVSRRITRGTHKWLSVHQHADFSGAAAELKGRGFRLYAAMLDARALPLEEVPVDEPVALVFGNEKEGISPGAASLCDGSFHIPMAGFAQSLNVSVAVAISLYSVARRARTLRPDGGLLSAAEKADILASWLPKTIRCGRRLLKAPSGPEGS